MRADVIVVGAGLIGTSVAWHLARTHDVLILEQGGLAGAEASAQNAGMVRQLVRDPVERALATRSAQSLAALPDSWSGGVVRTDPLAGAPISWPQLYFCEERATQPTRPGGKEHRRPPCSVASEDHVSGTDPDLPSVVRHKSDCSVLKPSEISVRY